MTELTQEQLAADRKFVRQQRELLASLDRRFPVWAMATTPKDVTARANQMARESCLLYPNKDPRGDDPCHYRGVMKDSDGRAWWLGAWVRTVAGQRVLEVQRAPKNNSKKA
jgi:hypothetical protein